MKNILSIITTIALCAVFSLSVTADDGDVGNGGRLPAYTCDLPANQCPPCDPAIFTCPTGNNNRSASADEQPSDDSYLESIWKYFFG